MLKRICILILLLSLLVPCAAFAATEWQSGQRHNWLRLNGRAGAYGISGASVGASDTLECRSGNTVEFFYAVLSGVSEIWPLTGGGITGFTLSSPSATTFLVDTRELKGTDIDQLRTLTGGNTPYASDSSVTPLMTQHTSAYTTSAGLTAYVQSQVSAYPNASQVTSWIGAGTSTFLTGNTAPSLTTVKNEVADGVSVYTLQTAHNAAGAPLSVTGASLWGGATPYIRSAVSDHALQSALTAHTGASVVSGASLTPNQVAAGPAIAWAEAGNDGTGISVYYTMPYDLVLTGVSLMGSANGIIGVSIYMISGVTTALPDTTNSNQFLIDLSKSTSATASKSGTTQIPIGSSLCLLPKTIANGVSNWTVQLWGRRE